MKGKANLTFEFVGHASNFACHQLLWHWWKSEYDYDIVSNANRKQNYQSQVLVMSETRTIKIKNKTPPM